MNVLSWIETEEDNLMSYTTLLFIFRTRYDEEITVSYLIEEEANIQNQNSYKLYLDYRNEFTLLGDYKNIELAKKYAVYNYKLFTKNFIK